LTHSFGEAAQQRWTNPELAIKFDNNFQIFSPNPPIQALPMNYAITTKNIRRIDDTIPIP
jgi:hypothetical protein